MLTLDYYKGLRNSKFNEARVYLVKVYEGESYNTMAESQKANLKKIFHFKIAGVSYKIKTSHDEQTVNELVKFVNSKVTDALAGTKNSSFQNAAVLAALNIAEEMILLKRRAQAELEKLESKALKLSQDLENSKANKVNWN